MVTADKRTFKTCRDCKAVKAWGFQIPIAERGRICLMCKTFYCEPCLVSHQGSEKHKAAAHRWVHGRRYA